MLFPLEYSPGTSPRKAMSCLGLENREKSPSSATRVIAIISPESAPVKRMIQDCRDKGELIDATYGRKTRAVLIMDSGQTILSAVQPETISHRLMNKETAIMEAADEG